MSSNRAPSRRSRAYRPGQKPSWVHSENDAKSGEKNAMDGLSSNHAHPHPHRKKKPIVLSVSATHDAVIEEEDGAQHHEAVIEEDEENVKPPSPSPSPALGMVLDPSLLEVPEADEEVVMESQHEKREEWRRKMLETEKESMKIEEVAEDEDDEESEYYTTSESESDGDGDVHGRVLHRPVFVSRNQRRTVDEKLKMERDEAEQEVSFLFRSCYDSMILRINLVSITSITITITTTSSL